MLSESSTNSCVLLLRLVLGAVLAALPSVGRANGMRLGSQDGFASARGEAFVATADNPAAIYYNPAGITQIEGGRISSGIYGINLNPTYTPPSAAVNAGSTYKVEDKWAAAPSTFLVYSPRDSRWSAGMGVYAPYGGSITWPQDTGFRAVALRTKLTYVTANPVIACELAPGLSIGVGAMVNYADLQLEQGIRRDEWPAPFVDYFRFQGEGWSVGYNAGILWQPHEMLSFGANFRSSVTTEFEGHTDVEFYPVIRSNYRSAAQASYNFPLTAVLGVSYKPTPRWNLEFDADFTDWSSLGTVTIYQANPNPNVQSNPAFILNWQPSWMYEFGITRFLDAGWKLSLGYVFNENSVPDAHYTPLAADLDRHFLTCGVGHQGKKLDFDVTYQFGFGPAHTVTGSTPSTVGQIAGQTADGTYKFISHAVLLTVGLRF